MQAIIETCGKQFSVTKGDRILVSQLSGKPGDGVTFERVLLLHDKTAKIGTPVVAGAQVQGKILKQGRSKKITVFKYKRRKGYHKKRGHRQDQTLVEITDITG